MSSHSSSDENQASADEVLRGVTCERCGDTYESGDFEDLECYFREDPDSSGSGSYITLCRPCHGVVHPEESVAKYRKRAPLYPAEDADPSVAYVNSNTEHETVTEFVGRFDGSVGLIDQRLGKKCHRCENRYSDERLTIFPAYEPDSKIYPGESCELVCRPCANLAVKCRNNESLPPILDLEGNRISEDRLESPYGSAKASGGKKDDVFGGREAVNLKERFYENSVVGFVHRLWGPLLTLSLIIGGLYEFHQNLLSLAATIAVALPLEYLPIVENAEVHAFLAILVVLTGVTSVLASTVRWGLTWAIGHLWRVVPSVKGFHFRRQVADRWMSTLGGWAVLYGIILIIPLLIPAALLYGFFANAEDSDGQSRAPQRSDGEGHKNWAKTAAWHAYYKW